MTENNIVTKVLEDIKGMTLADVNDLCSKLEEEFNISLAAAMPAPQASTSEGASAQPEKSSYTVKLKAVDLTKKIPIIKAVKENASGLNLMQAKQLVEGPMEEAIIAKDVSKEDMEKMKKSLESAGAEVEVL